MAIQEKQEFIKELAATNRRRGPLMLPSRRALLWYVMAFIVSATWMYSVQVFRPGFSEQLLHHPLFLLELASALLIAPLGAYVTLVHATPGERVPRAAVLVLWSLATLFFIGLASGFSTLAPETSTVGARHECWLEVLEYGAICLLMFVLMVRRGWVRFSWERGILYGLIAGLVPAALMQLACMYNPMHALVFHYLPATALIPLGLVAMRMVRKS